MTNRFISFSSTSRTFYTSTSVYPANSVAFKLHDYIRSTIFPSLCEVLEIDHVEAWESITTQLLRKLGCITTAQNSPSDWQGAGNVSEVVEDFLRQYRGCYSYDVADGKAGTSLSFSCFNSRSGNSLVWVHRFDTKSKGIDFTFSSHL
jgi:hypothetical protein